MTKSLALAAVALFGAASVNAECMETMEIMIEENTKMSFAGFEPQVNRITNTGAGNKIVLKGFEREPIVNINDGVVTISAGEPCDPTDGGSGDAPTDTPPEESSAMLAMGLPFLFGRSTASVIGSSLLGLSLMSRSTHAQTTAECQIAPIEVEIYVDATADEIVMRESQSGNFETCPPETVYWKHHPKVYGGYEGCTGEKGYYPCGQDSQGIFDEGGDLYAMYPVNWNGEECVDTGYTTETRSYWILWGDPLDKYELNKRTGLNPVVSFPFNRGPYPAYDQGTDLDEAFDDSADARAAAKDFLAYIEAFTMAELEDWDITMTEGAESGMTHIWAGKALEIARSTCNRDIYALMEAPAYGYSPSDSAAIVNRFASSFYNSTECECFATDSCRDPTVTVSNVGWVPGSELPSRTGGDGVVYRADSQNPASPWFESMVFPENPSGKMKTSQIGIPNRLVCDGVYLWPMYFGMEGYQIPIAKRPDCSAWSFSITKAYSASVRAGFIMYREDPVSNHDAMVDTISTAYSMTHGLYSEWSWYGQMQLWDMIKGRELSDPTSWIGAYSEIMEEKWALIIDGFEGCPVTQVSNPRAGAYVWFVFQEPYLGLQEGFIASWFRDVLGVRTTTYNFGFRGADPADFYGAGYSTADFARLQLYRDISVYEEVSRRAKIACSSAGTSIGDFVSTEQWRAAESSRRRRLSEGGFEDVEDRKRHLRENVPDLTERQLERLARNHEEHELMDENVSTCAPDYSMSCLFKAVGTRHKDM